MVYKVFELESFEESRKKYNIPENRIETIVKELEVNPYVGRHLGYKFLREKRYGGKRVFFLIYEELNSVLLVAASDKKSQESTISSIKKLIPDYKEALKEQLKF